MHVMFKDQPILGSSGDTYSTEETRIGTWIDGKPLYRRTVVGKTPTQAAGEVSIMNPIQNATIVLLYGGSFFTSTNVFAAIPYTNVLRETGMNVYYSYRDGLILVNERGGSYYENCDAWVVLEYTKTTDITPTVSSLSTQSLSVNSLDSVSQSSEKVLTAGAPLPSASASYASIDSIPTSSVSAKLTL